MFPAFRRQEGFVHAGSGFDFSNGEMMAWRRIALWFGMAVAGIGAVSYFVLVPDEARRPLPNGLAEPILVPVEVPFHHRWAKATAHPFLAAAAIDADGDGDDEVFLGGSDGQGDMLLDWRQGKLVDIAPMLSLGDEAATYGALSLDVTGDGKVDLLTVGNNGLWLWRNGGAQFKAQKIEVAMPDDSVPLAVAAGDYDKDGHVDLYLSLFVSPAKFRSPVFNDPSHAKANILLRNRGDFSFEDVTAKMNAGGLQNTFTSSFVDLDGDRWLDLVLAQNTGEIEILKNVEGRTFERTAYRSGFGFWMGLAFADIDNDADLDIFVSNLGNSIPSFLVKGDRRADQAAANEWALLRNEGEFKFTDVTKPAGLTGYGFAWGAAFEDLNFDGRFDLVVAQNYIKWPVHKVFTLPGKVLLGGGQGPLEFFTSEGGRNADFGHVPLLADLDGDGRNDVVWANMNGPARAYLNQSDGAFISVRLPDSPDSIGAKVTLEGRSVPALTIVAGEGLTSDRTTQVTFGLGPGGAHPTTLYVAWPNGRTTGIPSPRLNDSLILQAPPP